MDEQKTREKKPRTKKPMSPALVDEWRRLRESVADAVDAYSLRGVSRELGMSATGLRGLIDGATPSARTWDRLRFWYAQQPGAGELPGPTAAALVHRLLRGVPPGSRGNAQVAVLDAIEAVHRQAEVGPPAWIGEVRAALREAGKRGPAA
jgi:hypothetical protein